MTVEIWVDTEKAFVSNLIKAGDPPQLVDIDLAGAQLLEARASDLWQQRALGTFVDRFSTTVPARGAALVKVGRARS